MLTLICLIEERKTPLPLSLSLFFFIFRGGGERPLPLWIRHCIPHGFLGVSCWPLVSCTKVQRANSLLSIKIRHGSPRLTIYHAIVKKVTSELRMLLKECAG
jgi:hypothetical protein